MVTFLHGGMYRREARKLDVEIARKHKGQGHYPLDYQLYNNRCKARPGLTRWKRQCR